MTSHTRNRVVVIGAGHAGVEAALATARLGKSTLLLTSNPDRIGEMSCNPSIGGLGKSHLVREIDALGGEMALASDYSGIQFRLLNKSKGPAVQALRIQADRELYSEYFKQKLASQSNLTVKEALIESLNFKGDRIVSVRDTFSGKEYFGDVFILATGTFLNGMMYVGLDARPGGRYQDDTVRGLTKNLKELGLETGRLKTGTPARLLRDSIDFSKCTIQEGDPEPIPFSYLNEKIRVAQVPCFITFTNSKTHEIIRSGLDRSPLYTGMISGIGPRYCPSIEDKVVRFPDRDRHQIFLEPEGRESELIYPNGISSSLPLDIQEQFLHSIAGLENAEMKVPAYGIEYDFVLPAQLDHSLKVKHLNNLFLAGQINGTSGYEEAAAQGLVAGLNSVRMLDGFSPVIFSRADSYIGVMIDDLVMKGVDEPYRMFTSRAEYRLMLRFDNADIRLTETGRELGLVTDARYKKFRRKEELFKKLLNQLRTSYLNPDKETNEILEGLNTSPLKKKIRLADLLKRPEIKYKDLRIFNIETEEITEAVVSLIETEVKYEGYIERELRRVKKLKKLESTRIPPDLNYSEIKGLRTEARQKLSRIKPDNLGQALTLPGMTPADISVLSVFLKQLN